MQHNPTLNLDFILGAVARRLFLPDTGSLFRTPPNRKDRNLDEFIPQRARNLDKRDSRPEAALVPRHMPSASELRQVRKIHLVNRAC